MNSFDFQKFSIQQSKSVFRIGTDAVLLGALSSCNASNILEVGSGTGIITLMLAQRNPNVHITAIDLSQDAVNLSNINFKASPFHHRLQVFQQDFKTFQQGKFQQVISNPPYFEKNSSNKDILARQTIELNFHQLIQKSAEILEDEGILSVIIPAQFSKYFTKIAEYHRLFLKRNICIYGIKNGTLKRNILEFSKSISHPLITEKFIIEDSPRQYSKQYLNVTKDFHIFKKSKE